MYTVIPTKHFQRNFKQLHKKYRRLMADLEPVIDQLKQGEFAKSDAVPGFAHRLYKLRVASQDQNKGKSGGFRLLYYVVSRDKDIYLLTIYGKARQENIETKTLQALVKELDLQL